jgi:hypothetical protein
MNIDSSLWSVRSYGDGSAHITQRSTGNIRTVNRSTLPSVDDLAQMHELKFNRIMREAFHHAKIRK